MTCLRPQKRHACLEWGADTRPCDTSKGSKVWSELGELDKIQGFRVHAKDFCFMSTCEILKHFKQWSHILGKVQSLTWEDSTCCRATKPEHRNSWLVPQSLGAATTKPVCCNQGNPRTSQEEPLTAMRSPSTTTRADRPRCNYRKSHTATEPERSQEIINKEVDIWHEYIPREKTKHSYRLVGYKLDLWHENSFEYITCQQLLSEVTRAMKIGKSPRDLFVYLYFQDYKATELTSQVNVDNSCTTKDTEPFKMRIIWPYLHIFKLRFNSTVLYFSWSLRVV